MHPNCGDTKKDFSGHKHEKDSRWVGKKLYLRGFSIDGA
jgi:aromatic ring-cleaving dioxygenase